MNMFFIYFILFLIYSFLGWIIEVIVTFYKDKKFVNRGFLLGPYCPIYGFSSIIMILYLSRYRDSFITIFLLAVVVCSIIEYLVSYLMEKLFNARWWDYSNRKFNINGRVCLENSIWFGLLGTLLIYVVNPFLYNLISKMSDNVLLIVGSFLLIIFVIDLIISLNVTFIWLLYIPPNYTTSANGDQNSTPTGQSFNISQRLIYSFICNHFYS